jgi:hypothetical protein
MIHSAHIVHGRYAEPVDPYKAPPCLALSQDFSETSPRNDYARGFTQECVGLFPQAFARQAHASLGLWGKDLRELMLDFNHYAGWAINGECLPDDADTVTLDPDERDRYITDAARRRDL